MKRTLISLGAAIAAFALPVSLLTAPVASADVVTKSEAEAWIQYNLEPLEEEILDDKTMVMRWEILNYFFSDFDLERSYAPEAEIQELERSKWNVVMNADGSYTSGYLMGFRTKCTAGKKKCWIKQKGSKKWERVAKKNIEVKDNRRDNLEAAEFSEDYDSYKIEGDVLTAYSEEPTNIAEFSEVNPSENIPGTIKRTSVFDFSTPGDLKVTEGYRIVEDASGQQIPIFEETSVTITFRNEPVKVRAPKRVKKGVNTSVKLSF